MNETESTNRFSSRWGLLLSVLGIAVGTGNIWRFPRIAAQNAGENGAGSFLFAWFIFLLIWSVPLIIAEYALGRTTRKGVVGAFAQIAGPKYAWMGAFIAFVASAIMFYYSVVAGWCLFYLITSTVDNLPISTDASRQIWDSFQGGGWPVFFHALAMMFGAIAVWQGVKSIEKVNRVLIPTLLVIVLISLVRAVTLPGSFEGVKFLFTPDWSVLSQPKVWLEALTQNAWDTGAGWGLILTYGAYMQKKHGVVKNALITGVGNNLVSLIAAITIFGVVFAILGTQMDKQGILQVMQDSGPASTGLTFIWMPQLFAQMAGGKVLAILFFLGLSFAAFSSLISMIELATRVLVDMGIGRPKSIAMICGIGFLLGVPSAINLNILGNQDFVWGVALMICGAFVAFAVIRYGVTKFRADTLTDIPGDWNPGAKWDFVIKYLVPVQAVILLGWWLYQTTTYDGVLWYDPLNPYSLMTCLVQWSIILGIFILINKRLVSRTMAS